VRADATQMHQVVVNLCTNAWHALGDQPGRVSVSMALLDTPGLPATAHNPALAPGHYAHLWVSDTGCGIAEGHLNRLFEPFFTTKPVGRGTGLGLPVAHGIITSHGGTIRVDSVEGQGTTFHVYLPLQQDGPALQDRAVQRVEPTPTRGDEQLPPRRVLYVDDDEVMMIMVEGLLQRDGHAVTTCCDAMQALERLRAGPEDFDVLVTDYNMPGTSGLDLACAVRTLRPGLPIILSSGYLSDELQTRALAMGVQAVLNKEHTVERLAGLIGQVA
jgi:CheY-like chemotaxis protein